MKVWFGGLVREVHTGASVENEQRSSLPKSTSPLMSIEQQNTPKVISHSNIEHKNPVRPGLPRVAAKMESI